MQAEVLARLPLMATIDLKYGHGATPLKYDESRFTVLSTDLSLPPLSDAEIGKALDSPIDSPPLEDLVSRGQRVLLAVPDATRQTGAGQVVNLAVRRLIANGSAPNDINIIFATGIHRRVTDEEQKAILSPFIVQRIKTLHHKADDPVRNFRLGETSGGIPVELNWTLTEYDHVVLVGGITFHYFAGFTGGRKLICPGLASAKTIEETHKLAFDCRSLGRREGVGTGLLDGNPVHEAFTEAAAFTKPSFAINTLVDEQGRIVDLYCGNWISSHRQACDVYAERHTLRVTEKRDLVIVSCGGYPFDINMIQAHKALEAASHACNEGGTIIFFAECAEGLGRSDFLDWLSAADSRELGHKLCEQYQVNGQTAWSLLRKAESFDVRLVSNLSPDIAVKMRLSPITANSIKDIKIGGGKSGYIIPLGAKLRIV
ncbi:MAG TPA: nickel-dependent lactate racemase [Pyrinomonadaceae bacterium]|nr:nickel-dependent lactate racemase [Pyrinomonadaceae bacterium]